MGLVAASPLALSPRSLIVIFRAAAAEILTIFVLGDFCDRKGDWLLSWLKWPKKRCFIGFSVRNYKNSRTRVSEIEFPKEPFFVPDFRFSEHLKNSSAKPKTVLFYIVKYCYYCR